MIAPECLKFFPGCPQVMKILDKENVLEHTKAEEVVVLCEHCKERATMPMDMFLKVEKWQNVQHTFEEWWMELCKELTVKYKAAVLIPRLNKQHHRTAYECNVSPYESAWHFMNNLA